MNQPRNIARQDQYDINPKMQTDTYLLFKNLEPSFFQCLGICFHLDSSGFFHAFDQSGIQLVEQFVGPANGF